MISTREAATDALRSALADVGNQVAAARALLVVVGKLRLPAPTSWDAFQLDAEKLLEPWFKDTTQAAVWAVVYQYRNQLAGDADHASSEDDGAANSGVRVRCMADVLPEEVNWLWRSRIPRGKLSEIVGDPGVGKSWLTTEIVACVTTGRPLPGDESNGKSDPINVVLLSAEDGAGDTIRPRLDRAGADVKRVHIFEGIERLDGRLDPFDLRDPVHRSYLAGVIEDLDIRLLVIDPLTAYLGGVDSHRDSEVRGVLAPLAELAESSGCAVLTIRHLNKGTTSRAIYRAGGSIGFIAAVRSSMLVGQMDDESDERALVTIKLNLAAFPPPVGFSLAGGRFEWTGTPDVAASDLLRPDSDSDERSDRAQTVEWLWDRLECGPVSSVELFEQAKAELSVSERTVKRARNVLGDAISVYRESQGNIGKGKWLWKRSATVPHSLGTLADPETDTLVTTIVPQGFLASEGAQEAQGCQENGRGTLVDSDDLERADDDAYAGVERKAIQAESDPQEDPEPAENPTLAILTERAV